MQSVLLCIISVCTSTAGRVTKAVSSHVFGNKVILNPGSEIREITYHAAKHSTYDSHSCAQARTLAYHTAKEQLCGIGGPLQGWVVCTEDYEMFVNTE